MLASTWPRRHTRGETYYSSGAEEDAIVSGLSVSRRDGVELDVEVAMKLVSAPTTMCVYIE
jgi:hypothetical protein